MFVFEVIWINAVACFLSFKKECRKSPFTLFFPSNGLCEKLINKVMERTDGSVIWSKISRTLDIDTQNLKYVTLTPRPRLASVRDKEDLKICSSYSTSYKRHQSINLMILTLRILELVLHTAQLFDIGYLQCQVVGVCLAGNARASADEGWRSLFVCVCWR